jgi:hypothetical protein
MELDWCAFDLWKVIDSIVIVNIFQMFSNNIVIN